MLPQSFYRSWTSTRSLETALMLSAIMNLRWCYHAPLDAIAYCSLSALGSVPESRCLLDSRPVHRQTFGVPHLFSQTYCLLWLAHPILRRSAPSIAHMTLTMMLNLLEAKHKEVLPRSQPNGFRVLMEFDDKFMFSQTILALTLHSNEKKHVISSRDAHANCI
jgi:hypothetical protein